jgi:hypothetical protein
VNAKLDAGCLSPGIQNPISSIVSRRYTVGMTTTVLAHFDGQVFVPDEPVTLQPGAAVIVTPRDGGRRPESADFLRPLLFPPDAESSRKFLDDPETNLENF